MSVAAALAVLVWPARAAEEIAVLPGCAPLTWTNDLSSRMVAGIDRFLMTEIEKAETERAGRWRRDFSSAKAYDESVQGKRQTLRGMIGVVENRLAPRMEIVRTVGGPATEAENDRYVVAQVRWPVLPGVWGEGLLLRPKATAATLVVALPDADQTPELIAGLQAGLPYEQQFARRLAENGCLVVVPALADRRDNWSGNGRLNRFTNQPHREWIYRQAFEMGRHIIGYEVQKVLALVDWLEAARAEIGPEGQKVGVAGYGEGGLIALYSAALEPRIASCLVSGYFDSRQKVWEEPIYRNVFGLLRDFGDAELASLIAPRRLVVEYANVSKVDGPPLRRDGRSGAAPGRIGTPDFLSVEREVSRARQLVRNLKGAEEIEFVYGSEGMPVASGSERALVAFVEGAGVKLGRLGPSCPVPSLAVSREQVDERQERLVNEMAEFTQRVFRDSERVRDELVWQHLKGPMNDRWEALCRTNRVRFGEEVIGSFSRTGRSLNPRARAILDKPKWAGHEVVLEVWEDVFAWGYLLVPKDLRAGERRPVVVCQHGLEGVPEDVVTEDPKSGGFPYYQAYAARLADKGYVVFAPHNPYRGGDRFRVLQRKANPLGRSLFSVIVAQHEAILDWLETLPFVDKQRIGFYGLSYGGKTAMRVPALVERYCLSICSADFNEWVRKNATIDSPYSYMFTGEYEMPEWNLGHTFNYAEMASLIAPRPFMVERGHFDGVAPDSWVACEFAKIRKMYTVLGLPDRTEIEFFNGPHRINGVGTFQFLEKHLPFKPQ